MAQAGMSLASAVASVWNKNKAAEFKQAEAKRPTASVWLEDEEDEFDYASMQRELEHEEQARKHSGPVEVADGPYFEEDEEEERDVQRARDVRLKLQKKTAIASTAGTKAQPKSVSGSTAATSVASSRRSTVAVGVGAEEALRQAELQRAAALFAQSPWLARGTFPSKAQAAKQGGQTQAHGAHAHADEAAAKEKLRTSQEVLAQIRWNQALPVHEFVLVYEDRFDGLCEKDLPELQQDVTHDEFLPLHRVWGIKWRGQLVWDRQARLDLLRGLSAALDTEASFGAVQERAAQAALQAAEQAMAAQHRDAAQQDTCTRTCSAKQKDNKAAGSDKDGVSEKDKTSATQTPKVGGRAAAKAQAGGASGKTKKDKEARRSKRDAETVRLDAGRKRAQGYKAASRELMG